MPTGISEPGPDPMPRPDDGTWLETVALFEAIREGNQPAAHRLLSSSAKQAAVLGGLFSMLGVFLRGEDASGRAKLDRFIEASHRAGPPPAFGARPFLPPTDS
ncbi:hypothetical protein J2X12_003805 [Pseudarthrobacter oxydans]|uniref:Uncharacterized protein n=1 Tax=Pseudarthrobacter oxydans TaxID=1671 RepID=A0AAW8NE00_PSEOX|nr:hypothetical protein [Pseudarthrobacter oxydans]MBU3994385.1 hypothetical protein [Actinomycetota bacterium]MDR7165751.1 hypothetical protein [Pseudarthrobacter oxydans]